MQSCIFAQTREVENMKRLQNHLEKMGLLVQDFEEWLEFLFRHLIKIRVVPLSILNQ
ncbi:DUF241 domain protein [Medicago truncatula]|uniref:DUF241 domain protein n=1 Tax=Medicago truncatula TaxID=3880 RepID=G7JHD7_MEDTR|nr:DUF241 domain protein [Medicago truncatula]